MSDFFHDPTTDDQGDTFVIHTSDGLTLELCPTSLTVRDRLDPDAAVLARVPLNLDRIVGVAAGTQVTAHATHAHQLIIRRHRGGLDVCVTTPHLELFRRHLSVASNGMTREATEPQPSQTRPGAGGY